MVTIKEFVTNLKESMEEHSALLKEGEVLLPEYLKGKEFTSNVFPEIIDTLSQKVGLTLEWEFTNRFLEEYEIGKKPQRVDYVFMRTKREPAIFLELESLGRSQLYLFTDAEFREKNNDNKLWYYFGTLGNYFTARQAVPRFFVFLLCLPNRPVNRYQLWDIHKEYQIFHPALSKVVFTNPYRFYDNQIKAHARAFLQRECYFLDGNGNWVKIAVEEIQKICELVFITCTIDELILSRGKNLFDSGKERRFPIRWKRQHRKS